MMSEQNAGLATADELETPDFVRVKQRSLSLSVVRYDEELSDSKLVHVAPRKLSELKDHSASRSDFEGGRQSYKTYSFYGHGRCVNANSYHTSYTLFPFISSKHEGPYLKTRSNGTNRFTFYKISFLDGGSDKIVTTFSRRVSF